MLRTASRLVLLAGLLIVLGRPGAAPAQDPNNVSLDELDREDKTHRDLVKSLRRGMVAAEPGNKAHMDAIDYMARNSLYRLAHPLYHNVGGDASKTVNKLYQDFAEDIRQIVSEKEKTKEVARLFALKVIEHGRKVLDVPKPLVQVNAARFMARAADLGQPELADALAEILQDPKYNDAVKYYALQGLKKLLAQPITPPVLNGRAAKVLPPVMAIITRKAIIPPATTPEDEIRRGTEVDGFRVLRREAIRALAQSRVPMVSAKELPALLLAQVVSGEGFTPEVRMDERMEAAIGLARMRPDKGGDYQPDYAAEQIGKFLAAYATWYQVPNKTERRPARVPAAQLLEALEQLRTDTKDAYVTRLMGGGGKALLETIEKGSDADPSQVVTFVDANPAPSGQLFKSVGDSKIKPPTRKGE